MFGEDENSHFSAQFLVVNMNYGNLGLVKFIQYQWNSTNEYNSKLQY